MIPELGTNRSGGATVLRNLLIEEASKPFKIMQGPLLRVKLVRVSLSQSQQLFCKLPSPYFNVQLSLVSDKEWKCTLQDFQRDVLRASSSPNRLKMLAKAFADTRSLIQ